VVNLAQNICSCSWHERNNNYEWTIVSEMCNLYPSWWSCIPYNDMITLILPLPKPYTIVCMHSFYWTSQLLYHKPYNPRSHWEIHHNNSVTFSKHIGAGRANWRTTCRATIENAVPYATIYTAVDGPLLQGFAQACHSHTNRYCSKLGSQYIAAYQQVSQCHVPSRP